MLVLSRKQNEKIIIDGNITIMILSIKGGQIRIGIDAPKDVKILRGELSNKEKKKGGNPMLINKITIGFVIQQFNTETGLFTSQEFVAGDQVDWEDKEGNLIDKGFFDLSCSIPYLLFEMKQPNNQV